LRHGPPDFGKRDTGRIRTAGMASDSNKAAAYGECNCPRSTGGSDEKLE